VQPSGQKLTLGLLATITFKVVPFHAYAPFSALLLFFKFILEVMFWEGVFHDGVQCRLEFCLDHLNCVKMAAFGFIFNWGNREK
jgi:hypothetical protein